MLIYIKYRWGKYFAAGVMGSIALCVGILNIYRVDASRDIEKMLCTGEVSGKYNYDDLKTCGVDASLSKNSVVVGRVESISESKNTTGNTLYSKSFQGVADMHIYNYILYVYESRIDDKVYSERYKLNITNVSEQYKIGQTVCASGELKSFSHQNNFGGFDAYTYYLSKGVSFSMRPNVCWLVDANYNIFLQTMYKVRYSSRENLEQLVGMKYGGLLTGILLGDKSDIDGETKSLYTLCGMAHILAISGLHIALLGMMIFKLLRAIHIPHMASGLLSIGVLILYGFLCGFSNSCIRAVLMLAISVIAKLKGRRYDSSISLSLSLVVLLAINPYKIYDQGVWMSFGAIIALITASSVMKRFSKTDFGARVRFRQPFRMKVINTVVASFFINLITVPIVCYIYYGFSVVGFFLNFLVIPLMTFVVGFGLLGLIISYIDISLAKIIIFPSVMILRLYDYICSIAIKLPFGYINVGRIKASWLVLYYLVVVSLLMLTNKKYARYRKLICVFAFSSIFAFVTFSVSDVVWKQKNKLIMVDVGQGESVLVKIDGRNYMIDCGSSSKSGDNTAVYDLIPTLRYYSMINLDAIFLTHPDADHVNGIISLLEKKNYYGIGVDKIYMPRGIVQNDNYIKLFELANTENIEISFIGAGDRLYMPSGYIECLYPYNSDNTQHASSILNVEYINYETETNESSLVLFIKTRRDGILLTGDIGVEGLESLVVNNKDVLKQVTVFDLPHHGSKYSWLDDFYKSIRPKLSIISAGKNNRYGHPHKEILEVLYNIDSLICRTDENGAIMLELK